MIWRKRPREPEQAPRLPVGIGSSVAILGRLDRLTLPETVAVWQNTVRVLHDRAKGPLHEDARRVLNGVEREWERRVYSADLGGYFAWPTTNAPGGDGQLGTDGWLREGLLGILGYRVGNAKGRAPGERRAIRDHVFTGPLPPLLPPDHLQEWGQQGSAGRLHKIAKEIAAFTRNAKRRRSEALSVAIEDWEGDLDYLYRRLYVGKFHFAFPSTRLN
jgi:hypothetical protein